MYDLESEDKYQTIHEVTSLASGFMPAQILLTAVGLDLFTHLGRNKMSAGELAQKLQVNSQALEKLCNALTALGFLEKENNAYANAAKYQIFLVKGEPYYVGDNLKHQIRLSQRWAKLHDVVRTGKPLPREKESGEQQKQHTREFTLAMANIGQLTASKVVEGLDLRGVKKMIDIGGGPGTYAIEFVRKNPEIQAVLFDLPAVTPIAGERLRRLNLADRISTKPGDYFSDDFGTDYDLAFLSNVIHSLGQEEMVRLFRKISSALKPNGNLIVKDFFMNENRTGPLFPAQFAINMLLNTENGNTYTFSELRHALQQAQFAWTYSFEVGHHSTVIVSRKLD